MKTKILSILFNMLLFSCVLCTQAFANSVVTPVTESATEVVTYSAVPFTVEGNLTMDDNVTTDDNKEFYTVHSKNGNEFFIVVDKANDSNNVYFLNAVDEQDLLSLVDEYENIYITEATTETTTEFKETTTEATTTLEEVKNTGNKEGSILPIVIVLVIVGVIGFYKLKKKKNPDDDPDEEEVPDDEMDENTEETENNISEDRFNSKNENSAFNENSEFDSFNVDTDSDYETVEEPDEEDLTGDDEI